MAGLRIARDHRPGADVPSASEHGERRSDWTAELGAGPAWGKRFIEAARRSAPRTSGSRSCRGRRDAHAGVGRSGTDPRNSRTSSLCSRSSAGRRRRRCVAGLTSGAHSSVCNDARGSSTELRSGAVATLADRWPREVPARRMNRFLATRWLFGPASPVEWHARSGRHPRDSERRPTSPSANHCDSPRPRTQ